MGQVHSAAQLNYGELRAAWSAAADETVDYGKLPEDKVTSIREAARNMVQKAYKSSFNNINLTSSNLFTNALDPSGGCPPILALAIQKKEGAKELLGISASEAKSLLKTLKGDIGLYLRVVREQVVALAWEDQEKKEDELKSAPPLTRQVSNPLLENIAPLSCQICLEEIEPGKGFELRACGHKYCKACFAEYIRQREHEAGESLICCPVNECKRAVSQREIIALVGTTMFEKLDKRALERVIAHDNTLHMCATPDCCYIVAWTGGSDGQPWMLCPRCGRERCLKCGTEPYHNGKTCQEVLQERTGIEEKQTEELLAKLNYIPCPRCKTPIEKLDGCNKMLCFCGCKFCSVCLELTPTCKHVIKNHGYLHPLTGRFVYQSENPPDLGIDKLPSKSKT